MDSIVAISFGEFALEVGFNHIVVLFTMAIILFLALTVIFMYHWWRYGLRGDKFLSKMRVLYFVVSFIVIAVAIVALLEIISIYA
jgi:ABC-type spermidine/putrescine transport system permease subunit II